MSGDEPRIEGRVHVEQEGSWRLAASRRLRRPAAYVGAPAVAALVGGTIAGLGLRTSLAASVLVSLIALGTWLWWTSPDRTHTRGDLGRAILTGAGIAAVVGWVQVEIDRSTRERDRRQQAAARKAAGLAAARAEQQALRLQLTLQRNLDGIDLRGRDLTGYYLRNKQLAGARLDGARLVGADLRGTSLRDAQLPRADLRRAQMAGWSKIGFADQQPDAHLELPGAFQSITAKPLRATDLRDADMSGADLRGADLRGVDLSGADLTGADLRDTRSKFASFQAARLTGADLRSTLIEGSIGGADLSQARLVRATLYRSSRCGRGWGLTRSGAETLTRRPICVPPILAGADLRQADLRALVVEPVGVPPDFARGVDLDEAIFDRGTRWPEHFDPVQRGAELVPAP